MKNVTLSEAERSRRVSSEGESAQSAKSADEKSGPSARPKSAPAGRTARTHARRHPKPASARAKSFPDRICREARLRAIIEAIGVPADLRPSYLAFARELELSFHRSQALTQAQAPESSLQAANWKLQTVTTRPLRERAGVRGQGHPRVLRSEFWSLTSDFSPQTKRTVSKWFERGLSGRVMWLIGQALLQAGFGSKGSTRVWLRGRIAAGRKL